MSVTGGPILKLDGQPARIVRISGSGYFDHFTIDSDGCVRADDGANGASGAAILMDMGRVVALGGQARHVQTENFLGTGADTQFATLAIQVRNFDPALNWHAFLLFEKLDI